MCDTGAGEGVSDDATDGERRLVHGGVDIVGAVAELRQARRDGDRVTRQRAGLVDRPGGGEMAHHVSTAAESCGRQAATHDLAESEQVRIHAFSPHHPLALTRNPVMTSSRISNAPLACAGLGRRR